MDKKKLILNIFQYDLDENNRHSSLTQLCLLTIKSLLPSNDKMGSRIDYKRFEEELNLWKYYKLGSIDSLENIIGENINAEVYFKEDTSINYRILPIAIANLEFEIAEEEIIKNILYTSGNIRSLLKGVFINKLLYSPSGEELIEELKSYMINFGQLDFLEKYSKYYRINLENYPLNFSIEFEKEKIKIINILNGLKSKGYEDLYELLEVILEGKDSSSELARIFKFNGLEYTINEFFISMNDYVLKLNSGAIGREDLKISDYVLPDLFKFQEGDEFYHSLLNNSKVVKKEVRNNILTSIISTKTGMYRFRKSL